MNTDLLIRIIQQGANELKEIADNFQADMPNPLETDIAISKAETLIKEIKLFQEHLSHSSASETDSIVIPTEEPDDAPKAIQDANKCIPDTDSTSYEDISNTNNTDISQLININDKFQFIRELFQNNSKLYQQSIERLNSADSAENAKKIISSFDWNEEDDTVIYFNEIINKKFK